jgi:hypothetical protein
VNPQYFASSPNYITWNCVDAACSQLKIQATNQPADCATISVQGHINGAASTYTVMLDQVKTASMSTNPVLQPTDQSYVNPRNPLLVGYESTVTIEPRSACRNLMPTIDAHEEFPAPSMTQCASSLKWTDPIPQGEWGAWITLDLYSAVETGTFKDSIIDALRSGCVYSTT